MGKISLIVGGVRSGKSRYAIKLAELAEKEVAFLATCKASDTEMEKRIEIHKKSRPGHWKLYEEEINIAQIIENGKENEIFIIDCLGLWLSNLLLQNNDEIMIKEIIDIFTNKIYRSECDVVLVSNEVGMGIVPESYIGRVFRDYLGLLNQRVAEIADEVIIMQVGIPVKIK